MSGDSEFETQGARSWRYSRPTALISHIRDKGWQVAVEEVKLPERAMFFRGPIHSPPQKISKGRDGRLPVLHLY